MAAGRAAGECYLSRCHPLPRCDPPEQINDGLIHLPSIGRKARDRTAQRLARRIKELGYEVQIRKAAA